MVAGREMNERFLSGTAAVHGKQASLALFLQVVRELRPQLVALHAANLPDAWLGAGIVRNRVWDLLFAVQGPPIQSDWDVAFAGPVGAQTAEARLSAFLPGPWEAVDQRNYGHGSAVRGIKSWPETATAVGVRLRETADVEVAAPWGLDDLLSGRVCRTPGFDESVFEGRLRSKGWLNRWPQLTVQSERQGVAELTPRVVAAPW